MEARASVSLTSRVPFEELGEQRPVAADDVVSALVQGAGQAEIEPLFSGLMKGWAEALADYSDENITLVLDLFQCMRTVVRQEAALPQAPASSWPSS